MKENQEICDKVIEALKNYAISIENDIKLDEKALDPNKWYLSDANTKLNQLHKIRKLSRQIEIKRAEKKVILFYDEIVALDNIIGVRIVKKLFKDKYFIEIKRAYGLPSIRSPEINYKEAEKKLKVMEKEINQATKPLQ